MKILEVKNLHVNVGDKEILKGIDLDIFEETGLTVENLKLKGTVSWIDEINDKREFEEAPTEFGRVAAQSVASEGSSPKPWQPLVSRLRKCWIAWMQHLRLTVSRHSLRL